MINFENKNNKNLNNWLSYVRRDFHENPELGKAEYRTAEKIKEYLDDMGIKYRSEVAGTGIIAHMEGEDSGYTVAIRGDMDALPMKDEKKVGYSSKNIGVCHSCGHDAHMTMTLGVARYYYENKIKPPCNVRLFFQPAEETVGGAKDMIKEGALDGVNAVYGIHVTDEQKVGEISIKYGAANASSDTLRIKISGASSHGAYPSKGIDAILIASHVIVALQSIVSRNVDARDSAVITIGTINGGTQGNIIAESVELRGTLRTLNPEVRKRCLERIRDTVEKVSEGLGGKGEFIREEGYAALINHKEAVDIVVSSAEKLLGADKIKERVQPNMGVEDFAYFIENIKGSMFYVGVRNDEKGIVYPIHNGNFDIDENSLLIGTLLQVENINKSYEKKL